MILAIINIYLTMPKILNFINRFEHTLYIAELFVNYANTF